jgi:hypothetical protein
MPEAEHRPILVDQLAKCRYRVLVVRFLDRRLAVTSQVKLRWPS